MCDRPNIPTSTRRGADGVYRTAALLPLPDMPERGDVWTTIGVGTSKQEAQAQAQAALERIPLRTPTPEISW